MIFREWRLEVERMLYVGGHPPFNISQVRESKDYWLDLFQRGMTPAEAIEFSVDEAIDNS